MPDLFPNPPITDATRVANDRHQLWVVGVVLAALAVYAYFITDISRTLGIPTPRDLFQRAQEFWRLEYRYSGALDTAIQVRPASGSFTGQQNVSVLLGTIGLAFVLGYFAPLRFKKAAHVACTLVLFLVLYHPLITVVLLAAHVFVFVTLHPSRRRAPLAGGALTALLFGAMPGPSVMTALVSLGCGLVFAYLYGAFLLGVLATRAGKPIRTLVIQSPLIITLVGAALQGLGGDQWILPLGVLLFFWQWERLILYHVDYKTGAIPSDISLLEYLALFLTPATIPKWTWGVTIGQGYAYLQNGFYAEDKNRLALAGVKLWGVALLYFLFFQAGRHLVSNAFEAIGIPVFAARAGNLVDHYLAGGQVSTASVLITTSLDVIRWMCLWAGLVHFKVGIWRVFGYRVEPYFNKPYLTTNLVDFWTRFTYHYREFISRAFYYPVFFGFPRRFRKHLKTRVVLSTFAAVTVGNLVWGHVTEGFYYHGLRWENVGQVVSSWPYYVLLGLSIGATELYLLMYGKQRKPPWSKGRVIVSALAAYATLQAYGLMHIFNRPIGAGDFPKLLRLLLVGFGFPG